jgi:hypothetical protein
MIEQVYRIDITVRPMTQVNPLAAQPALRAETPPTAPR